MELRLILYFQLSGITITNQNIKAKNVFLSREIAIPSAQIPSVSREEIACTSGNNPLSEQLPFLLLDLT
jgi:hypothetical protein